METPPPATSPATPSAREITNLTELLERSAIPITVYWPPDQPREKQIFIRGRRLTAAEDDEIRMLLEGVLPKLLPPEAPGQEPREDLRDPEYQQRLRQANREARAYALYCCFPVIREAVKKSAGGEPQRKQIVDFVQGLTLDPEYMSALYVAATTTLIDDRQKLQALVDFT